MIHNIRITYLDNLRHDWVVVQFEIHRLDTSFLALAHGQPNSSRYTGTNRGHALRLPNAIQVPLRE
jgi:hypothetical protein